MCAIAGILGLPFDSQILDTLLHTMQHRGPDGTGSYMQQQCCLLHSRLAIVPEGRGTADASVLVRGGICDYIQRRTL